MLERIKKFTLLAWLLIVFAAYLRYFPPAGILDGLPAPRALSPDWALLLPLALLPLVLAAAAGFGSAFWHGFEVSGWERLLFSAGSGLGVISMAVLAADLAGFAFKPFFIALLAAGLAMLAIFRPDFRDSGGKSGWLLLAASLPALISALIGALAPPTQFDSLVYHLALPYKYASAGAYAAAPLNIFSGFPQNIEMLYQLALALNGDILANLIHWSFLPLTALGVYLMGRRSSGAAAGAAAALIWLYTPAALFVATGTYIDLGLAFYVFLSVQAYVFWDETGEDSWLWASAAMAGLAAGAKYTAAFPAAVIALLAVIRSRGVVKPFKFGLIALLVFAPWLAKNLVYCGSPVAPWGTPDGPAYFAHIKGHGIPVASLLDLLYLPWNLTFFGFSYGGAFDLAGPLLLLFLPALFLWGKSDKITRNLVLFSTGFAVCWFFSGKVLRFLLPVIPILSVLAAKGLSDLAAGKAFKTALYAVLAVAALHNLAMFHWTMAPVDPYSPVLAGEPRSSYLARKVDYYDAARVVSRGLPSGSRTLFWGETRSYYAGASCDAPTVFNANPAAAAAEAAKTPGGIGRALRRAGYTHMLINYAEAGRLGTDAALSPAAAARWTVFKLKYLTPVFSGPDCGVFAIAGDKK